MQARIAGIQPLKFQNNTGETISGTNLFCLFKDENVEGHRTEKFFIKENISLEGIKVNDVVELHFSMKGKVEAINK